MSNYQKATKPLTKTPLYKYKNRKMFLAILIILLILWILFSDTFNHDADKLNEDNIEQTED